jgi:hypothetical protein
MPAIITPDTYRPILRGTRQRLVSQHALNALTCQEHVSLNLAFIPMELLPSVVEDSPSHVEHFASPMVHPVTGETISSYKKIMNNPATSGIWQTAFGKDFRGMAQGNHKTGQKGTNAMFVMTHNKIRHVLRQNKKKYLRQFGRGLLTTKGGSQ